MAEREQPEVSGRAQSREKSQLNVASRVDLARAREEPGYGDSGRQSRRVRGNRQD